MQKKRPMIKKNQPMIKQKMRFNQHQTEIKGEKEAFKSLRNRIGYSNLDDDKKGTWAGRAGTDAIKEKEN